jgi:mRNA interferase MazF
LEVKRGEIYYADLSPVVGSEQDGIRPILIIQNNKGNKYSPTVIGIAITSKEKNNLPTHIKIVDEYKYGLPKNSVILVEQIRTLDKSRLKEKVGVLDFNTMEQVKKALKISFNIRGKFADIFGDW